jgi:hypothetical protein
MEKFDVFRRMIRFQVGCLLVALLPGCLSSLLQQKMQEKGIAKIDAKMKPQAIVCVPPASAPDEERALAEAAKAFSVNNHPAGPTKIRYSFTNESNWGGLEADSYEDPNTGQAVGYWRHQLKSRIYDEDPVSHKCLVNLGDLDQRLDDKSYQFDIAWAAEVPCADLQKPRSQWPQCPPVWKNSDVK